MTHHEVMMAAIKARRDGEFDHPALMQFGPLSEDTEADVVAIREFYLTTPNSALSTSVSDA